ncbi:hypothetical protein P872_08350 [Rhodonellum psychrophilum GCM71 = DSM 17998]|uniref:Uncharacterized protein n=2 Tax=Rhodonellum TaxID=336827 RepID=U5BNE9_9BACT|nr:MULTISPECIES: hypothetical protein [Rhodonellum]ERM82070.1 hypothetical protein P872_08350 [Rhodonellum psychrophilum GCM71 = DSM 17998]MDO9551798.1 bifunctional isocitrate dehydrogenase kinase/phosphatase [Rhodonellum sp.]SDZ17178.1 hypothetical protein SAMN05444412_10717 [Rhodonellum ikkaensis]
MEVVFFNRTSNPIWFFLLILAFSCSSDKETKEETSEALILTVEEKEMTMVLEGLGQFPEWTANWKSIEPGFDATAFDFARGYTYEVLEWPEENFIMPNTAFYPYLVPQPDGNGVVDIYSYKVSFNEEGKPYFNPDSEVIYFKSNGMRERLLFIGPSGAFEEAIWVSPDHLLVAGIFEEETGVRPIVWLIIPGENRYLYFESPVVSSQYPREGYLKKKLNKINFLK